MSAPARAVFDEYAQQASGWVQSCFEVRLSKNEGVPGDFSLHWVERDACECWWVVWVDVDESVGFTRQKYCLECCDRVCGLRGRIQLK